MSSGNMREEGEKLLRESERILRREVEGALNEGDFNLTVRRAQEVVELCLKGALKMLGVEYSRVHDVAPLFSEQVQKKREGVEVGVLEKIEEISLWLSQARAPAFYFEREYGEEDARQAHRDARFVLAEVKKMVGVIGSGKDSSNEAKQVQKDQERGPA
jgi:HEPN domain-containing protein